MTGIFSKYRFLPAVFILLLMAQISTAQELSTESRKAKKYYEEGNRNFSLQYYDKAKEDLLKAIDADDKFIEAYMLLGDVYKKLKAPGQAIDVYEKVINLNAGLYPEVYFFSGLLYFDEQEYSLAIKRFQKFLKNADSTSSRAKDAIFYKKCAEFARNALSNPVSFSAQNLGESINTPNDEYINAVRADGLTLFFTGRQCNEAGRVGGDDFYFSTKKSTTSAWELAQKLGPPVNTSGDEGALTISPDGRYLLFAGCHWPDGFGSCDIYAAKFSGNKAGMPVNLGSVINTANWESQPSLSSDGRTLYFAATGGNGFGKSDIWSSYLQDDGRWTKPENLGSKINTSGSEMAPFIHPDGQTLYFSSDRQIGMGGIDLFLSRLDSTGNWSIPLNLGYPVNTPGDEINIVVNAAGDKGYISADKLGGYGGFDIFEFEMHDEIRPVASTYMKGKVVDAISQKPLEAYFSLSDLKTKKEVVRSFSDESTGSFLVCIPSNREYALNVSREGYLFYSENFSLTGIKTDVEPYLINIALQPVKVGETIVLRNIFFDTGKYELKDESVVELEKLVQFLNFNPGIKVEISGHTDNIGTKEFNLELSANRARAVYEFLISNKINPGRLTYKGYGFSTPLSDNETAEGRSRNRRTEVKIIEMTK